MRLHFVCLSGRKFLEGECQLDTLATVWWRRGRLIYDSSRTRVLHDRVEISTKWPYNLLERIGYTAGDYRWLRNFTGCRLAAG